MKNLVRFFSSVGLYVSIHYILNVSGLEGLERFVVLSLIFLYLIQPESVFWKFLSGFSMVYLGIAATHTTWPVDQGWWREALIFGVVVGVSSTFLGSKRLGIFVSPAIVVVFYLFRSYGILAVVMSYAITTALLYVISRRKEG